MIDKGIVGRTGEKAYNAFEKWCICFALRNQKNEVTGLYFRSILNDDKTKHFYLKDRKGIYLNYPKSDTKKLILTEAIIDAASLLQIKEIRDNYNLISCFGTNGLNEEILNAIKELLELEEIIFCFDQDDAGKKAVKKYAELLKDLFLTKEALQEHLPSKQTVKFSNVELPNKDVNETLQYHNEEIFRELLEKRTFIFSTEKNGSGVADHLSINENGTGKTTGLKHQFRENEGSNIIIDTKTNRSNEKVVKDEKYEIVKP